MIRERYERYEHRMLVLSKIWNWIKTYYKVAILPPVALVSALLIFLGVMGTITDPLAVQDCVYGEMPAVFAEAFLSNVSFEYAEQEDGEWSSTLPGRAGQLFVRTVSKNGYGKLRYGEAVAFTVRPAPLHIEYGETACAYGEQEQYISQAIRAQGLVGQDVLADVDCSFILQAGNTIRVSVETFRIVSPDGRDVTECYDYRPEQGSWTPVLRPITLSSGNVTVEYDGELHGASGEVKVSPTPAPGDRVVVQEWNGQTDAGSYENTFTAIVVNEAGQDVTRYYSLSYNYGRMTVDARPIEITTADAQKEYDGTPLSDHTYEITAGSLVFGHQLKLTSFAEQRDVGTMENNAEISVLDESGCDVSANYRITLHSGTLTVEPRPITLRSDSATKQYDGTPLRASNVALVEGSLAKGHELQFTNQSQQTDVGESKNIFTCIVNDASGQDVTANYEITYEYGSLNVTPIVLVFRTGSAEKVYDGKPLTNAKYELLSGKPARGHSLLNVRTTGSQTDAGESANSLKVTVVDANGKDVTTKGYRIEVEQGTLTVKKRDISVSSQGDTKKYDGTPLTHHGITYSKTALVTGHRFVASFTGSQTEVGNSPNTFTVTIKDASGVDKTHNYNVQYEYGTLEVTPSELEKHESSSATTIGGPMEPPTGKTLFATFTQHYGDATVYLRERSYGNYDGSGWSAPPLYTTSSTSPLFYMGNAVNQKFGWGTFDIKLEKNCPSLMPYYVSLAEGQTAGITATDDVACHTPGEYRIKIPLGKEYSDIVLRASKIGDSQYYQYVRNNYLDVPESTKNELLKIAEQNGIRAKSKTLITDIQNYISHAAVYKLGIDEFPKGADKVIHFLTVTKEGYCQHFASAATLMYRAFGIPARYTVGFMAQSFDGVKTEVTDKNAHAWVEIYVQGVGWIPMEVTAAVESHGGGGGGGGGAVNADGQIMLTVTTYSAEKYFDGHHFGDWQGDKYWVSKGTLLPGHKLSVTLAESNPALISPSENANGIASWSVMDASGEDVSHMYYVIADIGYRVILKNPITIVTASATKVYDGTKLVAPQYWVTGGTLAPEHQLVVTVTGSQTNVGSTKNTITWDIIDTRWNHSVKHNYNVTVKPGTLKVTE